MAPLRCEIHGSGRPTSSMYLCILIWSVPIRCEIHGSGKPTSSMYLCLFGLPGDPHRKPSGGHLQFKVDRAAPGLT